MSDAALATERTRAYLTQRTQRLAARELRAELLMGLAFLSAGLLLAVTGGPHGTASAPVVLAYVVSLAAVSRVQFDIGAGFTVPTQVVFLPLLFLVRPGLVPLLVAGALVLAQLPDLMRGRVP